MTRDDQYIHLEGYRVKTRYNTDNGLVWWVQHILHHILTENMLYVRLMDNGGRQIAFYNFGDSGGCSVEEIAEDIKKYAPRVTVQNKEYRRVNHD